MQRCRSRKLGELVQLLTGDRTTLYVIRSRRKLSFSIDCDWFRGGDYTKCESDFEGVFD